jgi:hypothetical protein
MGYCSKHISDLTVYGNLGDKTKSPEQGKRKTNTNDEKHINMNVFLLPRTIYTSSNDKSGIGETWALKRGSRWYN